MHFKPIVLFVVLFSAMFVFASSQVLAQNGGINSVILKKDGSAATYMDGKLVSTRTTLMLRNGVKLEDSKVVYPIPDKWCGFRPCTQPEPELDPLNPFCLSCPAPHIWDAIDIRRLITIPDLKDALKSGRFTVQQIRGNRIYRQQ